MLSGSVCRANTAEVRQPSHRGLRSTLGHMLGLAHLVPAADLRLHAKCAFLPTSVASKRRSRKAELTMREPAVFLGLASRGVTCVAQRLGAGELPSLEHCFAYLQQRGASKKSGGSSTNLGGNPLPKHMGVKLYGGQRCIPGNIIVKQRGTLYHPGANVGMGKDHTLYALKEGLVKFHYSRLARRRSVSIEPLAHGQAAPPQLQLN